MLDILLSELLASTAQAIESAGPTLVVVPTDILLATTDRHPTLPARQRPSLVDLAALLLAERFTAVLVTGDRQLRELASQAGIEVHGTLWLLDLWVRQERLSPTAAADAVDRMLLHRPPRRLPERECRDYCRRWRQQGS